MVMQVGDIWRLYNRTVLSINGSYQGLIIRKKNVHRRSKAVIAVNKAFAEAAKACKGRKWNEFQACIRDHMAGKKFAG